MSWFNRSSLALLLLACLLLGGGAAQSVAPDLNVDESRGVFTFLPSKSLLTVGNGGDQISSLPANMMVAAGTVYEAHWQSGGITVGVVCPRLNGESDQHHAGRFANDVASLKQMFPPNVTTPSH